MPPDLVEVTRAASTLILVSTYMLQGVRAVRSLVTLRRLPPAPPSTLFGAFEIVLRSGSAGMGSDPSALRVLCDSDEPLLAGVANGIASYVWERESDLDNALRAARRMLDSFDIRENPWMRVMAHSRIGELCMQVEQGAEAAHLVVGMGEGADVLHAGSPGRRAMLTESAPSTVIIEPDTYAAAGELR